MVRDEVIGGNLHDHFIVAPIERRVGMSINMNINEMSIKPEPRAPE
jgi:aspartate ammonia-lyase